MHVGLTTKARCNICHHVCVFMFLIYSQGLKGHLVAIIFQSSMIQLDGPLPLRLFMSNPKMSKPCSSMYPILCTAHLPGFKDRGCNKTRVMHGNSILFLFFGLGGRGPEIFE